MATTPADTLTEQHRRAQLALRALVIRQLLTLWPSFDPLDMDRTWPAVREALKLLINVRRTQSAALAGRYYRDLRRIEGIPGDFAPRLAAPVDDELLNNSLGYSGPGTIQRLDPGRRDGTQRALVSVTGTATRHVMDGGRETLVQTIEADERAIGYVRITDDSPCAWCAMMASRGVVYKSRQTALLGTEERKGHDSCGCTVRPMYRDAVLPERNERYRELWRESTHGLSGNNARIAFRRALEGR